MKTTICDRDGWPLREGSRCRVFTREGKRLKKQVIVTGFDEGGNVEHECLKTLNVGVSASECLQLIARRKDTPSKVLRYQINKEIVAEASRISKKRKKGARR